VTSFSFAPVGRLANRSGVPRSSAFLASSRLQADGSAATPSAARAAETTADRGAMGATFTTWRLPWTSTTTLDMA